MEEVDTYFWLCSSAFAAGALNSIAGGGTLLTFPALASVIDPALANATSTMALLPGSIAGALGYRRELWEYRRFTLRLLLPSLLGGAVGAWLVVWAPNIFAHLVPWLILTAAILFLIQKPISKWLLIKLKNMSKLVYIDTKLIDLILIPIIQFIIATYGGYFGAGIGIIMLSILSYTNIDNIHSMNAIKTFLAACINSTSCFVFIYTDMVIWKYALPMIIVSILGGYVGARIARRLPRELIRWMIIVIAFSLSIYYFVR
jgi:uncharacterized membrane protein YfcA